MKGNVAADGQLSFVFDAGSPPDDYATLWWPTVTYN